MKRNLTKIAALFALVFLLVACSNTSGNEGSDKDASKKASNDAFPITLKHTSGETTIKEDPSKIVVIDIAALDTIDAVGMGDKVVGTAVNSLTPSLKKYESVTNIGTLKEPDMEAIAKLNPDLVIIGSRLSAMYNEFSNNWPTIDASVAWPDLNKATTYTKTEAENIEMVASAVGAEAKGQKAGQEVLDLMEKYKDKAKGQKALVLMSNAGEISMHSPASRFAPIFEVFGFESIGDHKSDDGHKGQKISFETVKQLNPDWIFVLDRDKATGSNKEANPAMSVMDNDLVNSTKAAKNKHIVYLSPVEWYITMTGANNYKLMLDEIAKALGI